MKATVLCRASRLVALMVVIVFAACACAAAAQFAANTVIKQGKMQMTGKVYVSGNKIRQETSMGGQTNVVICRGDKGLTWMLSPSQKTYIEAKGAKSDLSGAAMDKELLKVAAKKKVGSATINGYPCEKYLYTFKDKQRGTMTQCFSKKLQVPIKTEIATSQGSVVVEMKNIKEGKQPASLFELPKGYKKVTPGPPPAKTPSPKKAK